eukprot:9804794-Alexandrium_andersonii.AAC.1
MDYTQNGPVCKHVGAVLLTLATGGPGGAAAPHDGGAPQPEAASSSGDGAGRPGLGAGPDSPESVERSA